MPQEMVQEAVEIVTMSVDKFINVKNYEVRRLQFVSVYPCAVCVWPDVAH